MGTEADGHDPRRNAVLRAIPDEELDRVLGASTQVEMTLKEHVHRRGSPIEHLYFPVASVFSLVALVDGGTPVEVTTIGPEGVVGLPVFLGTSHSPNEALCQVAGPALRLPVPALHRILASDGSLHGQLHRYTQASLVQLAQNVACNRMHSTEERAARWLLTTQDRVGRPDFLLTQEFLAQMLGVRRPTVSSTAGALQDAGLIRYTRGHVTITDRERLLGVSCDCYGVVRTEFDRLVGT